MTRATGRPAERAAADDEAAAVGNEVGAGKVVFNSGNWIRTALMAISFSTADASPAAFLKMTVVPFRAGHVVMSRLGAEPGAAVVVLGATLDGQELELLLEVVAAGVMLGVKVHALVDTDVKVKYSVDKDWLENAGYVGYTEVVVKV
ncbi:MAG: hypothetical protein Q9220_000525 [cf. Caloplaca sp. 1 TL-2023]